VDKEGGYLAILMRVDARVKICDTPELRPPTSPGRQITQGVVRHRLKAMAASRGAGTKNCRGPAAGHREVLEGRSVSAKEDTFPEGGPGSCVKQKPGHDVTLVCRLAAVTVVLEVQLSGLVQRLLFLAARTGRQGASEGRSPPLFFGGRPSRPPTNRKVEYALARWEVGPGVRSRLGPRPGC